MWTERGKKLLDGTLQLFEGTSKSEGGQLVVPTNPGLGLALDQAAIKRCHVGVSPSATPTPEVIAVVSR